MRGKRITKPEKQAAVPSVHLTLQQFEDQVVASAASFSVSWRRGRWDKGREEYPTLSAAVKARGDDPTKMVYACAANGRSVCIAPKDYGRYLELERAKQ